MHGHGFGSDLDASDLTGRLHGLSLAPGPASTADARHNVGVGAGGPAGGTLNGAAPQGHYQRSQPGQQPYALPSLATLPGWSCSSEEVAWQPGGPRLDLGSSHHQPAGWPAAYAASSHGAPASEQPPQQAAAEQRQHYALGTYTMAPQAGAEQQQQQSFAVGGHQPPQQAAPQQQHYAMGAYAMPPRAGAQQPQQHYAVGAHTMPPQAGAQQQQQHPPQHGDAGRPPVLQPGGSTPPPGVVQHHQLTHQQYQQQQQQQQYQQQQREFQQSPQQPYQQQQPLRSPSPAQAVQHGALGAAAGGGALRAAGCHAPAGDGVVHRGVFYHQDEGGKPQLQPLAAQEQQKAARFLGMLQQLQQFQGQQQQGQQLGQQQQGQQLGQQLGQQQQGQQLGQQLGQQRGAPPQPQPPWQAAPGTGSFLPGPQLHDLQPPMPPLPPGAPGGMVGLAGHQPLHPLATRPLQGWPFGFPAPASVPLAAPQQPPLPFANMMMPTAAQLQMLMLNQQQQLHTQQQQQQRTPLPPQHHHLQPPRQHVPGEGDGPPLLPLPLPALDPVPTRLPSALPPPPPRPDQAQLDEQLQRLAQALAPAAEETARNESAFAAVRDLLLVHWPGARVVLFGSAANGLGIADNNDIDVCLELQELPDSRDAKASVVERLGQVLEEAGMWDVFAIPNARMPVVKCVHPESKVKVDITVNNRLAMVNTQLLRDYASLDPRLRGLVLLVKHWAKSRRVNEAYTGTLSSYAYVLLAIRHLQCRAPPILPVLQELPPTFRRRIAEWTCDYHDDLSDLQGFGAGNQESLAQLLISFFHYWAHQHNYNDTVISVRMSRALSKQEKGWTHKVGTERHLVCIEDPFELSHDLGRTVHRDGADKLRREFYRAARVCAVSSNPVADLFEPAPVADEGGEAGGGGPGGGGGRGTMRGGGGGGRRGRRGG